MDVSDRSGWKSDCILGGAISTAATFPTTANAFQTTNHASNGNAFVSKIDTTLSGGSSLAYSTFIGGSTGNGSNGEGLVGLAVDSGGKVSVVGYTLSSDYPVTATAYQSTSKAQYRMATSFLSQIDTTKSGSASLVYSTYFGGSAPTSPGELGEQGNGVTLIRVQIRLFENITHLENIGQNPTLILDARLGFGPV
jgi:hypothetical protein